jgi:DNA-3-methyladenine glycosylase II
MGVPVSAIHRFHKRNFRTICDQLASTDKDLARIIRAHGYSPMWTRPNTFETLVHIILEQQVSLASALAALNKLRERLGLVHPEAFLELTDETLKACYFSRQKMGYARGLAKALVEGRLDLASLEKLPDEVVRKKLGELKGIGPWTIDVYLMFVLQRADVFPVGDLAAVQALRHVKQLSTEIPRERLMDIAAG